MTRPRVQWQVLDGADYEALWTAGWLPDSSTLRWSLTDALRVESVRAQRWECYEAAEAATVHDTYVAENSDGEYVEVTPHGEVVTTGEPVASFFAATVATLESPSHV